MRNPPHWRLCMLVMMTLVYLQAHTVQGRMRQYGPAVHARLHGYFTRQQVAYPPRKLTLIGLKDQRKLLLYAPDASGAMRFIREYDILAASGVAGPKLREGDSQVPEGVYGISVLNPDSTFHLSLGVSYPNAFDRAMARRDGRNQLGGDIMIHGNAVSSGCLAMGDTAAEELFVLAAETGCKHVTIILCPVDFRTTNFTASSPAWTPTLYTQLRAKLAAYPLPPSTQHPRSETTAPDPQSNQDALQSTPYWAFAGLVIVLLLVAIVIIDRLTERKRVARKAQRMKMP